MANEQIFYVAFGALAGILSFIAADFGKKEIRFFPNICLFVRLFVDAVAVVVFFSIAAAVVDTENFNYSLGWLIVGVSYFTLLVVVLVAAFRHAVERTWMGF